MIQASVLFNRAALIGHIILSMALCVGGGLIHKKGNHNNFLEVDFDPGEEVLKKAQGITKLSKYT